MTHTYFVTGMTCKGCTAKVKTALQNIDGILNVDVRLEEPQVTIQMERHIPLKQLQAALNPLGKYKINTYSDTVQHQNETKTSWLRTYRPVLLLFAYILSIAVLLSVNDYHFDALKAMRIFMGSFFIAFSFFKILDLRGFADSYSAYDIIAKHFHAWGFIYAFIELLLGVCFILDLSPLATNLATLVVMLISLAGVVKSVLNKNTIKCACLGSIFNLPVSTVTIIEDGLMVVMSTVMLLLS